MFAQPKAVTRASPLTGKLVPGLLPTGGINARDVFSAMPPTDALDLVNVDTNVYGLSSRGGYQWWAWNLPGSMDVPTIMSYYPATATGSGLGIGSADFTKPRVNALAGKSVTGGLFACTNKEIFDITSGGDGPWTAEPGLGIFTSDNWSWRNFQNAAGNFLIAANEGGGYVVYDGATFTRATLGVGAGQVSGIDPDLVCYIMVWKRRLWFIEKGSSRTWYLPVEQIYGVATLFDFGSQFRHGGALSALVNWTLDGGEGVDDYLVAFSAEGDVVIYKGYDPDDAATDPNAFQLHGLWYVGALPKGYRAVDPYGGDVYILSVQGVTALSQLVNDRSGVHGIGQISEKIDPLISGYMRGSNRSEEWYIKATPTQEYVLIGLPPSVDVFGATQLMYKYHQKTWQRFDNLPVAHFTTHDSLTWAGGDMTRSVVAAGKVFLMFENSLDNAVEAPEVSDEEAIVCRVVPAYNGFGTSGQWKIFTMLRPGFLTSILPSISITVLTDYQTLGPSNTPSLPVTGASLWDAILWDVGLWMGGPSRIRKWFGIVGGGYSATAQIDFETLDSLALTDIDWWIRDGGPL